MTPVEKAIDDAFMWGQIDTLNMVLGRQEIPQEKLLQLLIMVDGTVKVRDQLAWEYMSWCLAHNLAVGALGTMRNNLRNYVLEVIE